MIRFLYLLLYGDKIDSCKSCQTLKEQIAFERAEKAELTATLISILKPKEIEAAPIEVNPLQQTATLFSRKRAMLEERDRLAAKTYKDSTNIGKPDIPQQVITSAIDKLEQELGVTEGETKNG